MRFRPIIVLVICAALSGCAGSKDSCYTIELQGGALTLTPMAENAIRVRMTGSETLNLEELIYTEKIRSPRFKVREDDARIVVSTAAMSAVYDKSDGHLSFTDAQGNIILSEVPGTKSLDETEVQGFKAYSAGQTFVSPADEFLFGTGQFQDGYLNVRGLSRRLTQVNTQISLPMIISNKGYGILWNNNGMTEFNPADSCVLMSAADEVSSSATVNVTGTSGNRREMRLYTSFDGVLNVTEAGDYALLLDVGQKMARKHWLAVDGEPVIDMTNMWLPPTASVKVSLTEGEHRLSVQGVRGDSPVVYWRKLTDDTRFYSPVAEAVDYTVFAGGADRVVSTYRKLTGQVPEMPEWMFGYIHCRERFHSSDEILATATRFREENIPLGVIVQDWQWWGRTGWNSMEFDSEFYPDPKSLTDGLHEMDTRLMLSVWSKVGHDSKLGAKLEEKAYYIPDTEWIDFLNPEAASYYWESFRDSLVTPYSIDVWWLDATEPENDDLDGRIIGGGKVPGAFYRNSYPSLVVRTVYQGMKRDTPDRTPVIFTRSAFPGMQRYGAVTWSGDVGNDYKTLKYQIVGGLGQMAAGLPWWTYDAGGFFRPGDQYTNAEYQERMLRWIQTSVFLPFMRVHGYMSQTEPWMYSPETYENFVNCIRIREALKPYILDVAGRVSKEGYTMMRPLVFDFPSDTEALRQDTEYMFGPSLLVCPVLEPEVRSWKVYLPEYEEGWVSLTDGLHYDGGQYVTVPVGPDMIPVFAVADKYGDFADICALMGDPLALSEGDSIVFDSTHWDFGKVDDNAGTVQHTYAFINPSMRPFRIGAVDVSCSCTSVEYSRDPVPAGGRGELTLSFMPAGAAGSVYRTAEIYDEDGRHITTISMVADVNRVDADIEDLYHFTVSERLLTDRGNISFGYTNQGQTVSKLVRIANVSQSGLSLRMEVADPNSMLSVEYPDTIGPRSEEEILLTYRIPDDRDLYGLTSDEVLIFADGKQEPTPLHVSAICMAALPVAEKTPSFWTSPSLIDLQKTRLGSSFKGSLELGNSGEADLHILAVVSPVEIPLGKGTVIAPGQTLRLKVNSPQEEFVAQVFTDDPTRPYRELIFQ